jgi:hypothetical protein
LGEAVTWSTCSSRFAFGGFDFELDVFDLQCVETGAQNRRQRGCDASGRLQRHVEIAGVGVVELQRRNALYELHAAAQRIAGQTERALGGIHRRIDRGLHDIRRQHAILNHLHVIRQRRAAAVFDRDLERNGVGLASQLAIDAGAAILGDGAHPFQGRRDFEG